MRGARFCSLADARTKSAHIPVLLKEVIEILNPKLGPACRQAGDFFIDGTVGSAGHTASILKKMMPRGKFLALDWDKKLLEKAKKEIEAKFQIPPKENLRLPTGQANSKFQIFWVNDNYANLPEILKDLQGKKLEKADGLLLDLGFSSDQLEKSGRGFSFLRDEPLIMRYQFQEVRPPEINRQYLGGRTSQTLNSLTAADVVNAFSERDLADIFFKYGEERFSRRIAKKIVEERKRKPIKTTFDLVEIIRKAVPKSYERGRLHPATRTFQALRIYVNNELGNLSKILSNLADILKSKGRVVIISYHSLEDRIVKQQFKLLEKEGKAKILTKKPIRPTFQEIQINPRSRSAKLRAIILN